MDIDCVVIGVNSEKTLKVCIQSIIDSRYTQGRLHIYYVDGGSTDKSVSIASEFDEVSVIQLNPEYPTPGMGRNAGWKRGKSPFVHFFDSDVIVAPDWMERAVKEMKVDDIGAVRGNLNERYPDLSVFNWIGNLEWNVAPGKCDSFGGIVMIRRSILEDTGGYDEELVAGEDPELSQRVKILGWEILHLDVPMCSHDLAMMKVRQYWKRAHRTGYGYAAVALKQLVIMLKRFAEKGGGKILLQSAEKIAGKPLGQTRLKGVDKIDISFNNFWLYECFRIKIRGGGFIFLTLLSILLIPWAVHSEGIAYLIIMMISLGLLLLFYPLLFRVSWFMKDKKLERSKARIYAAHCSLVVIPEFFGLIRYFAGLIFNRPLRNKRAGLGTGVSRKI